MSRSRPTPNTAGQKLKRINRRNLALFIGALMDGATLRELVDATGMNYETIRPTVNELHKAGVLHVTAWKQDPMGRWSLATYQLGRHVDAAKPRAKTPTERTRKYQVRKAQPELVPSGRAATIANPALDQALRGWR